MSRENSPKNECRLQFRILFQILAAFLLSGHCPRLQNERQLGILHFAHLILKPMRGIYLRFTTSSVYIAQVFRARCPLNVLARQGYSATFQSSKWATLLSDVRSVTPFKLRRPPTPARYRDRLFLRYLLFYSLQPFILTFCNCRCP